MRARGRRCGARKFCVVFLLSSGGSESMLNLLAHIELAT